MKEVLKKQAELLSKCAERAEPALLVEISKAIADVEMAMLLLELAGNSTQKKNDEPDFEEICEPVVRWLRKNHHPHCKIVIDSTSAELMEGALGTMHSVTD